MSVHGPMDHFQLSIQSYYRLQYIGLLALRYARYSQTILICLSANV